MMVMVMSDCDDGDGGNVLTSLTSLLKTWLQELGEL